jgi:hypothetical protein
LLAVSGPILTPIRGRNSGERGLRRPSANRKSTWLMTSLAMTLLALFALKPTWNARTPDVSLVKVQWAPISQLQEISRAGRDKIASDAGLSVDGGREVRQRAR